MSMHQHYVVNTPFDIHPTIFPQNPAADCLPDSELAPCGIATLFTNGTLPLGHTEGYIQTETVSVSTLQPAQVKLTRCQVCHLSISPGIAPAVAVSHRQRFVLHAAPRPQLLRLTLVQLQRSAYVSALLCCRSRFSLAGIAELVQLCTAVSKLAAIGRSRTAAYCRRDRAQRCMHISHCNWLPWHLNA